MRRSWLVASVTALGCLAASTSARAADAGGTDKLTILFAPGSAAVDGDGTQTLDHASRLYRAGHPIVMIVSGSADKSGNPEQNLVLSERRARNVLNGLADRGIPVDRLQLLAKGVTDAGGTDADPNAGDRKVEITWR